MDNESSSSHKIMMDEFMTDSSRPSLTRTLSVQQELLNGTPSLSFISPKYKTATPTLFDKWKSFKKDPRLIEEPESPTPVDDIILLDEYNDEAHDEAFSVTVCKEMIRKDLIDLMKSKQGNVQILYDIENLTITPENIDKHFENTTKFEKNVAVLWAIFLKRKELTAFFIKSQVDLNFYEPRQGFGALHLSGFSGCTVCTQYLLDVGVDVNLSLGSYTPLHCAAFGNSLDTARMLLDAGAKISAIEVGFDRLGANETALHSAVRAKALDVIQLFLERNVDINCVAGGTSALHIAADLGYIQCLKLLLLSGRADPNIQTTDRKYTPLHYAAESGFVECIRLLLQYGADASISNHRQQTPLHLASKMCLECVQVLLSDGRSNSNALDTDNRTPLHVAVSKSESEFCFEITELLIQHGSKVNSQDKYGYTPLHIAALNELSDCVDSMIYRGADVCAKTKGGTSALGIISRKIPASLSVVEKILDESLILDDPEVSYREFNLKFNFRYLLQSCTRGEMTFLQTFVDEGQKDILHHPLCEAFLYLKWQKMRKYYIARLIFYFFYVVLLSLYVLTVLSYQCYNVHKIEVSDDDIETRSFVKPRSDELCKSVVSKFLLKHPGILDAEWFVLLAFTLFEIIRKIYGIFGCVSLRKYLTEFTNLAEVFVLVSVFAISFIYTGETYPWQNHIGAVAVLFGWANLMIMIGHLPIFGTYVTMYTRVQKEFSKLFLAYICLLIGFVICFCAIFPRSTDFTDPFTGVIKILVMMTGELDFKDLKESINKESEGHKLEGGAYLKVLLEISAHVVFVLFLVFVTIILMNLLVGIAVHDIQGLQRTAGLSKLVDQTKLISQMEQVLFQGGLPSYFLKFLRWTALVSPSSYRVLITVKPLNAHETRLPKEVMRKALELCKQKRKKYPVSRHSTKIGADVRRMQSRRTWCNSRADNDVIETLKKLTEEIEKLKLLLQTND